MNLERKLPEVLYPKCYLAVYENYLEVLPVERGKILAAKPISMTAVNQLKEQLNNIKGEQNKYLSGQIPANLIYIDSDPKKQHIIWKTAQMKKMLLFTANTGIKSGIAIIPPMIWSYNEGELSIFHYIAWMGLKTKLYGTIFPNIQSTDNVCLGNVKTKETFEDLPLAIQEIQNYFFNSQFTHKLDKDLTKIWNESIQKKIPIPNNKFKKTKLTIKNLIE